jgi:hypothetical protein
VQGGATHDLHVEVALADDAVGGLPADGEGVEQQVVEILAVVEAGAELARLGLQRVIVERRRGGSSSGG